MFLCVIDCWFLELDCRSLVPLSDDDHTVLVVTVVWLSVSLFFDVLKVSFDDLGPPMIVFGIVLGVNLNRLMSGCIGGCHILVSMVLSDVC
jgi:hypothetical protein